MVAVSGLGSTQPPALSEQVANVADLPAAYGDAIRGSGVRSRTGAFCERHQQGQKLGDIHSPRHRSTGATAPLSLRRTATRSRWGRWLSYRRWRIGMGPSGSSRSCV